MKQALLVIDVQNDYFQGGKMELPHSNEALSQINELEKHFHSSQLPIIYIQHIKHQKPADFFEVDTWGAQLHPHLLLNEHAYILEKHYPNAFLQTDLLKVLQALSIRQLVITGMMTHMCIDSTVRASREFGFQSIVIADATATKALSIENTIVHASDVQTAFLAALSSFAAIQTTKEFLSK